MISSAVTIAITLVSLISGYALGAYITDTPEKSLTNTDLVEPVCMPDYMARHGEGLCRELFCRMSSNKTDGKTGAQECEQISNIINSQFVYDYCDSKEANKDNCFRYFRERK